MFDFQMKVEPTGKDCMLELRFYDHNAVPKLLMQMQISTAYMAFYIDFPIVKHSMLFLPVLTDQFWLISFDWSVLTGVGDWANRDQFRFDQTRIALLFHVYNYWTQVALVFYIKHYIFLYFSGAVVSVLADPNYGTFDLNLEEYLFGFLLKYFRDIMWLRSFLLWTHSTSLRIKQQAAVHF